MSSSDGSDAGLFEQRLLRVQRVIDECVDRRIRGERVSDQAIITAHPELMPELGTELANLAVIERARRRAASSSGASGQRRTRQPAPGQRHATGGELFAGYEILGEIHRGGQGVVYKAIQVSTRREVAIKVTREGSFAGPREIGRFEREVQILGALKHPNIVTIHDSGIASSGSFYFVMDYVPGEPLDRWISVRSGDGSPGATTAPPSAVRTTAAPVFADIPAALRLFLKICDAVSAAHLRGVIHRDLKPSNVRLDDAGEPRVLDFGLAKLVEGISDLPSGSADAPATMTGQFVGSLPWASPEQAAGSGAIDVRTDVYSLGVMLYQMLTGGFPYDVTGNMRDVLDRIMHADPRRPSLRNPRINDEVETIVLKCLAKEPERRYQTAGELARDIRRYLAGEPIEAKRDSGWYVLSKTLARHKAGVSAALAFVLLVSIATAALAILYGQQSQTLERALAAEQTGARRLMDVEKAREAESRAHDEAGAVNAFLVEMLKSVDPDLDGDRNITVREVLDRAAASIGRELAEQPGVEAAIRLTIGHSYLGLGLPDQARPQIERSLELRRASPHASREALAKSYAALGTLRVEEQKYSEADAAFRQALDLRRAALGDVHSDVAESLFQLGDAAWQSGRYDEAEEFHRRAAAIYEQLNVRGEAYGNVLMGLALVAQTRGNSARAETLYRQALEIYRADGGRENLDTAGVIGNLAILAYQQGRNEEAEALTRETLEINRRLRGDAHPAVATGLNNLAAFAYARGDAAQAAAMLREVLAIREKVYGPDSLEAVSALANLATVLSDSGDSAEAEAIYRRSLAIQRRSLQPNHPGIALTLVRLGRLLQSRTDPALGPEIESLYAEALEINRAAYGAEHKEVATTLSDLASHYSDVHDEERAEVLHREALAIQRKILPAGHRDIGGTLGMLGGVLQRTGRDAEAEPLLRECVAIREQTVSHLWQYPVSLLRLGITLTRLEKFDEAEPLLLRAERMLAAHPQAPAGAHREALQALGELYTAWAKPVQRAEWEARLDAEAGGATPDEAEAAAEAE